MQKVCCGRQDTIIGGSKKRQFNQTGGEEDALPAQETDNAVEDNSSFQPELILLELRVIMIMAKVSISISNPSILRF